MIKCSPRVQYPHTYEPSSVNGNTTTSPSVSVSGESGTPTLRSPIYAPSTYLLQSSPVSVVSSTVFQSPSPTSAQLKEFPVLQPSTEIAPISSPPVGIDIQSTSHNGAVVSSDKIGFPPLSPKHNIFNKVNRI